jgi:protocatechuate 3,4-dioxygenase beta subunit
MKRSEFTAAATTLIVAMLVGHVTDATTGQPLAGVTISIGSSHTSTDAHGAYRLTGLTPGRYDLTASSKDVPPQHRSVVVKPQGPKTTVDLVLCSATLDYSCAGSGPG